MDKDKKVKIVRGSPNRDHEQIQLSTSGVISKTDKKKTPQVDFWKDYSADEIAQMQGVKPIDNISELFGYWPEGADFESFFETAVNSREHADTK